ncbi:hypothetical protein KXX08_008413 [Aspergillus fumigatus]|nr:hypothetical protein KXX08_008413 [Aspergillus fumigatus]KAH3167918.1 hypothetical protein KXW49_002915 [Aspergillus fumigatus]
MGPGWQAINNSLIHHATAILIQRQSVHILNLHLFFTTHLGVIKSTVNVQSAAMLVFRRIIIHTSTVNQICAHLITTLNPTCPTQATSVSRLKTPSARDSDQMDKLRNGSGFPLDYGQERIQLLASVLIF